MNLIQNLLKYEHRCRPKGFFMKESITIHSTGNERSTALNERAWLDNPTNDRDASWHYVVGENEIIQAIPDVEAAWHCGNTKGNQTSIGIEIIESGNRKLVLENAAEFVALKLKEHNLSIQDIKKHYDWTNKNCPRILIDNSFIKSKMDWEYFINIVNYYLERKEEKEMVEEKRYNKIDEIPVWGKPTIEKLISKGVFADINNLNLSDDMLRLFVINDRLGLY